MAGELLLDTGGLVSLLDQNQAQHAACRRVFEDWSGPVVVQAPPIAYRITLPDPAE